MFNLFSKKKTPIEKLFDKDAKLPKHVAIIMDGNGRWAKKRGLPRIAGHKKGAEALRRTIRAAAEFGIQYATFYTFSTENWNRPQEEVEALFSMLSAYIDKEVLEMKKEGVKVQFRGRLQDLPHDLQKKMNWAEAETKNNARITVTSMINYGSRAELVDAFRKIVSSGIKDANEITEGLVQKNLYTHDMPDPDLLIRTASEMRISNYLLWQIAYSEFYVTPALWPDFGQEDLAEAIKAYLGRIRKFGGLK